MFVYESIMGILIWTSCHGTPFNQVCIPNCSPGLFHALWLVVLVVCLVHYKTFYLQYHYPLHHILCNPYPNSPPPPPPKKKKKKKKKKQRCEGTENFYHMFGSTFFKSARTISEHKAVDIWTSYLCKWKVNAILHITRLETYSYVSYLITPSCTIAEIWKYHTMKTVWNDHLHNNIHYLWLIQ